MPIGEQRASAEGQALWILSIVSAWMTAWIVWRLSADPRAYVVDGLGLNDGLIATADWIWLPTLAIAVTYAGYTLWAVPEARRYVLRPNMLGLVAIWAAIVSGILEEVLFRQRLMDWLDERGHSTVTQIAVSAGVFGLAHALWVVLARDWWIIVSVVASTAALGLVLATLYLAAGRSTFPAIVAHGVINLVIEPGLIVATCRAGLRAGQQDHASTEEPDTV